MRVGSRPEVDFCRWRIHLEAGSLIALLFFMVTSRLCPSKELQGAQNASIADDEAPTASAAFAGDASCRGVCMIAVPCSIESTLKASQASKRLEG